MGSEDELEYLKRRAIFLGSRSLLELEYVLQEVLTKELPVRVAESDLAWLRELVRILELDDYDLLDAILGKTDLGPEYDARLLALIQSYLPGRKKD